MSFIEKTQKTLFTVAGFIILGSVPYIATRMIGAPRFVSLLHEAVIGSVETVIQLVKIWVAINI